MAARSKALITVWTFLLFASGVPRLILQEVFHIPVSADLGVIPAATVILIGMALQFVWNAVQELFPILCLVSRLVDMEWFVYTRVNQLPLDQDLLNHPSFNVCLLAGDHLLGSAIFMECPMGSSA